MRHPLLLVFVLAISMLACKSTSVTKTEIVPDGIQFNKDKKFELVLEEAKNESKLVFIEFYADWCTPCKLMDENVFSDKEIGDFFNKKFVNYKVNSEKGGGPDLAAIFEVRALPTLLFVDEIGRVVERREGAAFHSDLMNMAESALNQHETMTYLNTGD